MTHIGLIELGFNRDAIGFITGQTDTIEIDIVSIEEFELMTEDEQMHVVRLQCLAPEQRSGDVSDQEHATAETEPSAKESILNKSTHNFPSESMTRAQVQMLASLVHTLDPKQDPMHLCQELNSWRGTKTMDKLASDLVNVLGNAVAEVEGDDAKASARPEKDSRLNARTNGRMTFHPVDSVASNHRDASLPKNSQVQAIQNMHGAVTLFAWVDNTDGPADYVHHHARLTDFRMED